MIQANELEIKTGDSVLVFDWMKWNFNGGDKGDNFQFMRKAKILAIISNVERQDYAKVEYLEDMKHGLGHGKAGEIGEGHFLNSMIPLNPTARQKEIMKRIYLPEYFKAHIEVLNGA